MCDRNERATLKKRLSALGLPDYSFHLFRHTHASMMLNAGIAITSINNPSNFIQLHVEFLLLYSVSLPLPKPFKMFFKLALLIAQ